MEENKESIEWYKNLDNVSSFSEKCRICLSGNYLNLWKDHDNLLQLFHDITDVKVDDGDNFQKYVCNQCIGKLEHISKFIEFSKNNNFRKSLSSDDIKEECANTDYFKTTSEDEMSENSSFLESSSIFNNWPHKTDIKREDIDNKGSIFSDAFYSNEFYRYSIWPQSVQCDTTPHQNYFELKSRSQLEQESYNQRKCIASPFSVTDDSTIVTHTQSSATSKCTNQLPFPTSNTEKKTKRSQRKPYASIKKNLPDHLRPYECQFCKKRFTQKGNMQTHIRLHTGEKPFHCSMCPEQFRQLSNLNQHILHHISDSLKCNICFKNFNSKDQLKQHKTTHKADKPYLCTMCSKKFSYQWSLETHLKVHYKNDSQESSTARVNTSNEFTRKSDLKYQEQSHLDGEHNGDVRCKSFKHYQSCFVQDKRGEVLNGDAASE